MNLHGKRINANATTTCNDSVRQIRGIYACVRVYIYIYIYVPVNIKYLRTRSVNSCLTRFKVVEKFLMCRVCVHVYICMCIHT